jgi:transcriptional regulator with GAF, ATPase, and Fis domain
MSNITSTGFDFKAWYNQIVAERQRMEVEMARLNKLTEILAAFMQEQEARSAQEGFAPPDVLQSDFEQLTTINKKIQLLYFLLDVIREFSAETNDDRRMALVIDKAAQLVNADRSAVFLLDTATKEICAKVPDPQQTIRELRFPRDLGLVGYAASTGRTVNVPEASSDPHFRAEIDEKPVYQAQSILVTPLRDNGGQIFGVLEVLNKQDGRFTPDDEYLLQAFAAQAAMALKSPPPASVRRRW